MGLRDNYDKKMLKRARNFLMINNTLCNKKNVAGVEGERAREVLWERILCKFAHDDDNVCFLTTTTTRECVEFIISFTHFLYNLNYSYNDF